MENKTQVFFIHGGMTFKNREDYLEFLREREVKLEEKISWNKQYLDKRLESEFQLIKPQMPCGWNAKYEDWKIWFERFFEYLEDDVILIGSSLGGIFLAKYLSENKFPKKIKAVYLIAPPFDNTLEGEDLVGGFELGEDLTKVMENCNNVNLLFSRDDDCVPVSHAEKYREKLPDANIIIYEDKNGHFGVEEFPEIVEMIKKDVEN
ncbi:MAG: alpha/beta hydrolase [Nanoarchaeota archaeon]